MALDRPDTSPDRPEAKATSDTSPGDPDPYNVASMTRAEAYESARAKAAGQDSGGPLTDRPDRPANYWGEVARFQSVWDGITKRFPAGQKSDERAAPEASVAESADRRLALDKISDREPAVSVDVRSVEADGESGGFLVGFEFRLKSMERLSQKVAERIRREPERDPERIVDTVHDAIRYTFCIPKESYTAGCEEIKSKLESRGYEMYHRRNSWSDPEYKGLNTRWVTADGQRFEVQFHTRESFHAKHDMTHGAYERLRQPGVGATERQECMDFQKLVSSYVPVPDGAQDIPNFDKDA